MQTISETTERTHLAKSPPLGIIARSTLASFSVAAEGLIEQDQAVEAKGDAMEIKDEVAEYKRRRILDVAIALFDENGYAQTTMEAIAQQLGVSKPFVYSYFPNKTKILVQICLISLSQSKVALDQAMAECDTPPEQLRAAIEGLVLAVIDNQKSVNIFDREEKFQDEETRSVVLDYQGYLTRMLTRIVNEGNKRGDFDCKDVHSAVFAIGGIVSWIRRWYAPGGRMSREDVARAQADIALRIVGASPAPRNASDP